MAHYDDALTLREARSRYFEENALGVDGGYASRWVKLQVGPIKFGFPNLAARVRAVRVHDLHHLLTGYETDWKGEFEISAWEVAGSCRGYFAAWVLNIAGIAGGLFTYPRAVFRAFARGRHSRNLYGQAWSEATLERKVGPVRRDLGLDQPPAAPTLSDCAAFAGWSLLAIGCGLLSLLPLGALIGGLLWLARLL